MNCDNLKMNCDNLKMNCDNLKMNRDNLINWLNRRCKYANNIDDDPNYSDYYISHFNILDNDNLYKVNDIDYEINVKCIEPHYEKYVDYLNNDTQHMVILPGTNHSNANFIFKLIRKNIDKLSYIIPHVSKNVEQPFEKIYKKIKHRVDKEDLYEFIRENS